MINCIKGILSTNNIPLIITFWGVIIATIQVFFNFRRNHFDKKTKRAEVGYKLVDELFEDTLANEFLQCYDSLLPKYRTAGGLLKKIFVGDYYREMKVFNDHIVNGKFEEEELDKKSIKRMEDLLERVDSLLFHFNRIRHALKNGITNKNSISEPLKYYMALINNYNKTDDSLIKYANNIGDTMAIDFMQLMNK